MAQSPPPLFDQGPSALSRLMVASALALFLMVADARLGLVQPLRSVIATALTPLQWVALQPIEWAGGLHGYLGDLHEAQAEAASARQQLVALSTRASQVEQLTHENDRLRALLGLNERLDVTGQAAEVLYDTTDPYTRRVVINKGSLQRVKAGSPVLDESGVLGQVTRVYPMLSEVTLLIDRDQVIPVLNTRSGVRGLAHGEPTVGSGMLDLRFMPASTDVQAGDLFTTSGMDGVYPTGLPVAKVLTVEKRSDSPFLRIRMAPLATASDVRHVMVIPPVTRPDELDSLEAEDRQAAASVAETPSLSKRVVGAVAGAIRAGAPTGAASAAAPALPARRGGSAEPATPAPAAAPAAASSPAPAARAPASAARRAAPVRTRAASETSR
ncbi:rod shape-determining protein MreC [Comamonas serinivorans]|uniref:Cell shape-determining protein MreC n=1 Tax=Comamonas serinivorans TaxID=1082851 RepID=A0A1Y0EJ99_9BURK|nr:rod shape-determining protein MreC [Comamonas serinivorans]ARU03540.1 rod shape-determining protein MreC [Comamonas serinivorans]